MKVENDMRAHQNDTSHSQSLGVDKNHKKSKWKFFLQRLNTSIQQSLNNRSLQTYLRLSTGALIGGVIVLFALTWLNAEEAGKASAQTQLAAEVLMHSQRMGKPRPMQFKEISTHSIN